MLEILVVGLTIIGAIVFVQWRRRRPRPRGDQPVTFDCPHCGEKDCHCERRE